MRNILLFILLAAPILRSGAIELSLEENRAERGNIGYIDMKRLFALFPETQRAKESFEDSVRQAEEQLNVRKAELIRLRAEVGKLKTERAALAAAPEPPKPEIPKVVPPPLAPAAPNPQLDALLASTFTLPGFLSNASTAALPAPAVALSTAVVSAPAAPAAAPSPPPVPAAPSALQELDEKIAQKAKELSRKEADFREFQASTEKNLLDLENRKSEILLGKIHKSVQEIARKEGVSVVVDKSSILYGHNAVDLTEKVLRLLKGT